MFASPLAAILVRPLFQIWSLLAPKIPRWWLGSSKLWASLYQHANQHVTSRWLCASFLCSLWLLHARQATSTVSLTATEVSLHFLMLSSLHHCNLSKVYMCVYVFMAWLRPQELLGGFACFTLCNLAWDLALNNCWKCERFKNPVFITVLNSFYQTFSHPDEPGLLLLLFLSLQIIISITAS